MAQGTIVATLLVLLLAVCCTTTLVHGKEWIVDDKGWTIGISGWENGKRFKSGDVLVFKYESAMHNLVQVEERDYNSCLVVGPSKFHDSGNDHIQLAGGKAFFLCSVMRHCEQGMKMAVTVE
ncbi:hypothetical protein CFC21_080348 [Triticum aestivum]|uniref:Plantacyanin n=4 Tax=Triticinae TaxID=1648030 RepID=A0A453M760_AEGTS|nr:basic blue protein-like [Aegilops tauschii subsp. strangulata]XP_044402289.1 basic blue protein-like [Triticum aestivum]KAF7075584.1 hypothetical protein CFC21_080348 [Triticum aestivum]